MHLDEPNESETQPTSSDSLTPLSPFESLHALEVADARILRASIQGHSSALAGESETTLLVNEIFFVWFIWTFTERIGAADVDKKELCPRSPVQRNIRKAMIIVDKSDDENMFECR